MSLLNAGVLNVGLLALASLALTACSQEDYYCDADGCYVCDGLGCRALPPPGRVTCEGDCDCATGALCTSAGCAETCTANADCPRGTICDEGVCVGPTEGATLTGMCAPCTMDTECADEGAGYVCVGGMCRPPVRPACDETTPCAAGFECVDGECRGRDDYCQFSVECGPGRICVNQHCTTGCDATTACPDGAVCTDGFCVEQPPTAMCGAGGACGAGEVCVDGSCWDACTTTAECGEGRYCAPDGRCRFDDRPRPVASCISPARLVNGVCRTPCANATECRTFDEQLTFCGEDMLCYTTNEATSDCTAQGDCMSGQSCIDGICR